MTTFGYTGGFEAATRFVTPEQAAEAFACGPELDAHVEAVKPYIDAGFDEVAFVQIGPDHQEQFISWAQQELLPALRSLWAR